GGGHVLYARRHAAVIGGRRNVHRRECRGSEAQDEQGKHRQFHQNLQLIFWESPAFAVVSCGYSKDTSTHPQANSREEEHFFRGARLAVMFCSAVSEVLQNCYIGGNKYERNAAAPTEMRI